MVQHHRSVTMLHTHGYEVIPRAIEIAKNEVDDLIARSNTPRYIFNTDRNDRKRKQVPIRSNNKIVQRVHRVLRVRYPLLTPRTAVLLKSEPGCGDQLAAVAPVITNRHQSLQRSETI